MISGNPAFEHSFAHKNGASLWVCAPIACGWHVKAFVQNMQSGHCGLCTLFMAYCWFCLVCLQFLLVGPSSVVSVLGVGCVIRWAGCFEYVCVWNCVNAWGQLLYKSVAAQSGKEQALPPCAHRSVVLQKGCRCTSMILEGTVCWHRQLTIILSQYVTRRVHVNKCVDF